jgi:S-adenosylmethionine:tRNA-ribosyltransferase-isomerase (queuine synthetase)
MPLPPYIKYEKEKEQRYQTFFAEEIGSAAAPTASLHFTPELIKQLEDKKVNIKYLCLHVGLGTFKPVYEEHIEKQKLHFEPMIIPNDIRDYIKEKKEEKKIFLPVGTTMIRYLESLPYIWKYLRNINYINNVNSETINRRDNITKEINQKQIDEFIPKQDISTPEN